jgi:hypothetical protein
MDICQSCRKNSVEVIDDCDNPAYPYKVCTACHDRLVNMSLRPREYFNLVSRHGMTFLLHDDFYDENGTASAPENEVVFDPALAFPVLAELRDLPSIVDYAIVEWQVSDEVVAAMKRFEWKEVLRELDERLALNVGLTERICLLGALTCGKHAEAWMLWHWGERTHDNFPLYAKPMATCLPSDVGFALYSQQVSQVEQSSRFVETMMGLMHFQSKSTLSWIEGHIGRVSNISSSWGYLAAASQFDWATAKRWLEGGRPLSLVALDALANCAVTSKTQNSVPFLRENPPRLSDPDTVDAMSRVLQQYGETDKVPRVRLNISYILENWDRILKQ